MSAKCFRRRNLFTATAAVVLTATVLSPSAIGTARAQSGTTQGPPKPMPAAASSGLYQCVGPNGGTVFRSTPREGCVMLAAPDPSGLDPQRWLPVMGSNGIVSYLDQRSVRRFGERIGVVVMRNTPIGGIRTASGEPIRSSLRRMVLDCANSMYAVVEQTLFSRRYARGEPLYTIHAAGSAPRPASAGTLAREMLNRLCR